MTQRSSAFWRNSFFGGVVGLNVLMYFRQPAFESGWSAYLAYSAAVVACGGVLLLSFFRMRRLRTDTDRQGPPASRAQRRRAAKADRRGE